MLTAALAVALIGQAAKPIPAGDAIELDPKIRPILELPEFKTLKCITVSQYKARDPKTNSVMHHVRVYRFTYKATFADEVKRFKKEFAKSSGWRVEQDNPVELIMGRDLKHAKLKGQAVILRKDSKATFDASLKARTKLTTTPGWVSVSFNEMLKKP